MIRIDLERPEGVRWVPDRPTGDGVLVVAGSSGRVDTDRARLFADLGCVAESIRWLGGPGQHPDPWEIPLETFLDRIDDLKQSCDRVHIVGLSFGAEAALLCGAHSPNIDSVIAFAPTDVVWAGYDHDRETSHWTLDGRPLAYVPMDWQNYVAEPVPRYRPHYERSRVTFADRVPAATIPVDRIAQLILVAGGEDQVWSSVGHARRIRAIRSAAGLPTELIAVADAGHRAILPGEVEVVAGATMQRGGTPAADRDLGRQAWRAITAMLGSS
ncbi:alpha/beta fold hydrolase [Microlunatus endophyticus]|nr:alpha/beta fold hydrolase [Microlunatus endophyticus]